MLVSTCIRVYLRYNFIKDDKFYLFVKLFLRSFLVVLGLLSVGPVFAELSGFYSGELGQDNGVKIFIRQDGEKLYGYYGYDKNFSVSYIPNANALFGTFGQGNYVVLKHLGEKGEAILFKGFLDESIHGLKGDWQFPMEQPIELKPLTVKVGKQRIQIRHQVIHDENYHFQVAINYPILASSEQLSPTELKFNRYIDHVVFKLKNEFKRDIIRSETKYNSGYFGDSTLSVNSEVTYAKYPLLSVRLNVNTYYAGAIHAINSSVTVNFDLAKGIPLKFDALFKKYSLYLRELAELSRNHLKNVLSDGEAQEKRSALLSWITRGTQARSANFKSWNLTELGILLSFDPYQVAPYALGRQEIIVPYGFLSEEFGDEYQIA